MGTKRPGVAPFAAQRRNYAELLCQGVSNSEACRLVEVNRRTGTRSRYQHNVPVAGGVDRHYAPTSHQIEAARSPRIFVPPVGS